MPRNSLCDASACARPPAFSGRGRELMAKACSPGSQSASAVTHTLPVRTERTVKSRKVIIRAVFIHTSRWLATSVLKAKGG